MFSGSSDDVHIITKLFLSHHIVIKPFDKDVLFHISFGSQNNERSNAVAHSACCRSNIVCTYYFNLMFVSFVLRFYQKKDYIYECVCCCWS